MSEEPINFPEPVPTNHGNFEGPVTYDDFLAANNILEEKDEDKKTARIARLMFQERQAAQVLAEKESDKTDPVTGVLKREVFRREADYKLTKLNPGEKRFTRPNNAIIGHFDGKGLKEWNDTKGHAAGDTKLYNLGQIIKAAGRDEDDLVGRGGDGSDEFGSIYFFSDSTINSEEMMKKLNERILYLVKFAERSKDIAGLKWKLVPYEQGKDINELLHLADPIPGSEGLMEWPPSDVLPSRK